MANLGRKSISFLAILGVIGLVVAISGCTSYSASTYNGSQRSFQYPSVCQVKEIGADPDGSYVRISKNTTTEALIKKLDNLQSAKDNLTEGLKSQNQENISGISCDVLRFHDGTSVYLFEKNGKQFSLMCGDLSQYGVKQIIGTIQ